jgi:mannose-6-phosphate isomerase-like protein (cupin superfamily)
MVEQKDGLCPIVVPPGQGRFIGRPDSAGGPTIKLDANQSGGAITVYESHRPAGDTGDPAEHFHHECHELFYVLEGEYRFLIDGQAIAAPQGTFIFVPRGVRHTFRSTGEQKCRMLTSLLPGGLERYFEELSWQPKGGLDPQANAEISARHGMTVVGPPGPPLEE